MASITPADAVPLGYAVASVNTVAVQLKATNTTIFNTKWTGTGPDGKVASGMYAVAGGKRLADGGAELARQEHLAVWAERGAIDDVARQHLGSLAEPQKQEAIGFFGSVRGPEVFCDKLAGPDQKCLAAQAVAHAAQISQVATPIVAAGGTVDWQNGPFFSGKASPNLLMALRHHPAIATLSLEPRSPEPTSLSSVWGDSVVGWATGVYPVDVAVCLVEAYAPVAGTPWMDGLQFAGVRFPAGLQESGAHANQMADILAGTVVPVGLALGAQIFVANWMYPYGASGPALPMPWWYALGYCTERQTTVWNFSQRYASFGTNTAVTPATPVAEDRYFDWLALQSPYPTIVASASNYGNAQYVGNKLRNGLVVGGSQEGPAQLWQRLFIL